MKRPGTGNATLLNKEESGFTILEIVTSISISATFLISFIVLVNNLNVINDRTRDLTVTNSFVENKVEDLRNAAFVALPADTTVVDFTTEMPQTLAEPRSATYTVNDLSAGVKRLDFVITYNEHGRSRTVNYSTAIGELGVGQY